MCQLYCDSEVLVFATVPACVLCSVVFQANFSKLAEILKEMDRSGVCVLCLCACVREGD